MSRILVIVVAYRPREARLAENLARFAPWVDRVLLWRNSPLQQAFPEVELCGDESNRGIAPALNYALDYARREGYDWLLTMDQDSVWEDFLRYRNQVLSCKEDALFGPPVNEPQTEAFQPCPFLITSGMLARTSVLERIGGWRADFYVDALDVDLVLKALSLGIPVYRVGAGLLRQQFGRKRKLEAGFTVYDYPPERLYGIFRNHILTFRAHPEVAGPIRKMFFRRWVLSRIPRILLGEKNRWEKLKAIVRGIRDGLRQHALPHVALVTWFDTPNYGTTLQAYATLKALQTVGTRPYLLHRFDTPSSPKAVKDNWHRRLGIRRFWKYAPDPWPWKTRRIHRFVREEMPARWVCGPRSLHRLILHTDLFLCGSDQIWNAHDHFRDFELLSFVNGRPKAAFASSIGTADIPLPCQDSMRRRLASFGPISLREAAGVEAIQTLTGRKDILLAGDPTFLLTAAQWQAQGNASCVPGEPYLLTYLLRPGQEETVQEIARAAGLARIVAIPAGENPHPAVGEVVGDCGIREFLSLLGGASLVVTDSFHGVALSANLSRDMLILKRFSDKDPASQNGRLYELCERLGLQDRFYEDTLPAPVAWEAVQERIAALRESLWQILRRTVL